MSRFVAPGATLVSRFNAGTAETGAVGTVRFRLLDSDAAVDDPAYGPSTANITEDPTGSGSYLFIGTAPEPGERTVYYPAWDLGDGELFFDEDIIVTSASPYGPITGDSYGNVDELARRLKIREPTPAQTDELTRVLTEATTEINSEIDLAEGVELTSGQIALATGVNYDRAVELWAMSPFGIIGLGTETGGMYASKDSWAPYANRLAPLKNQWGFA